MQEITVEEFRDRRADYILLDVREPEEIEVASLPHALQIPIGQITRRWRELPDDATIAVLCHHGVRSSQVTGFLSTNGIEAVNIAGGIDAWSQRVDPGVSRY